MGEKYEDFVEEHPNLYLLLVCLGSMVISLPIAIGVGYLQSKMQAKCLSKETAKLLVDAGVNLDGQGR